MMRDEDLPLVDRQWGAAKAGPLIHPALASVETTSHITGHLTLEALVAATLPKPKRIAGELAEMQENDE